MEISATTWTSLSKLLDEAFDLDSAARAAWLRRQAASQPELATVLRKLLAAHASSETADVLARLPTLAPSTEAPERHSGLAAGDRVGPYRLKRELGSGGMADVWLADRADGAFVRDVALKLPHINRLRRDLAARFARERDILARLEHPHIARLYDAGVAGDGLPYLAMEYVAGQPITAWCDARKLDIAARLQVFAQVLDAVQYAHANLVIHRDLKPSNILVTAEGQVRLLDFGIAKLIADDERAHETQLTQLAGRALTPDYASPEQIKGDPLTIASDVYSLGVVLYELLAGNRPYKLKLQSAAQLEFAILEAESAPPSTNIAEAAPATRFATPRQLARLLAGDLDTIALKALAKAPADRYGTIAAFADDLQRYRDGRPVTAIALSRWYRLRKFVVRNKLGVGAGAVVASALLAATLVSMWQAERAQAQATAARREAKRAESVQNFLLDIFRANSDRQADPLKARDATARELLDLGAERVTTALKDQPEDRASILKTLAEMYDQLSLADRAADLDRQRVELLTSIHGPNDPRVAEALIALATSLESTARRDETVPLLEQARAILDANGDKSSRTRGELMTRLAQRYQSISFDKMLVYADEAVRILRAHRVENEDRMSTALLYAARARTQLGQGAAGEALMREAIGELRKDTPVSYVSLVQTMNSLAEVQAVQFKVDAAEQTFREALQIGREKIGDKDAATLWVQSRLASFLHATGRREEGRRLHDAALREILATRGEDDPVRTSGARIGYGRALLADGNLTLADDLAARAVTSTRQHYAGTEVLGHEIRVQAAIAAASGRYEEARALFAEGLQLALLGGTGMHPSRRNRFFIDEARLDIAQHDPQAAILRLQRVVAPLNAEQLPLRLEELERDLVLSQAHVVSGNIEAAFTLANQVEERIERSPLRQYVPALEAEAALRLGQAEMARGAYSAARPYLERALALRTAIDHSNSPWLAEAQIELGNCMLSQGDRIGAVALLNKARTIHAANTQLGDHFRRPLIHLGERLRERVSR